MTQERMNRLNQLFLAFDPEIVEAALCLLIDQLEHPASPEDTGSAG